MPNSEIFRTSDQDLPQPSEYAQKKYENPIEFKKLEALFKEFKILVEPKKIGQMSQGYAELHEIFHPRFIEPIIRNVFANAHTHDNIGFFFLNFTARGWKAAEEIFGLERSKSYLTEKLRTDLFGYSHHQWHNLAEVLGDNSPQHDLVWRTVTEKTYPRAWIEGIESIKEKRAWMNDEEFQAVLVGDRIRKILIKDKRNLHWPLGHGQLVTTQYFAEERIVDHEEWQEWKIFLGPYWMDFLQANPSPRILEKIQCWSLETIAAVVPNFQKRFAQSFVSHPEAVDLLIAFTRTLGLHNLKTLEIILDELFGEQRGQILSQIDLITLFRFFSWTKSDQNKKVWINIKEHFGLTYIEELLQEKEPFFKRLGLLRPNDEDESDKNEIRNLSVPQFSRIVVAALEHERQFKDLMHQDEYLQQIKQKRPELVPFLCLRYATRRDNQLSQEVALKSAKSLAQKIEQTLNKQQSAESLLPAVGVEIEVMSDTEIQRTNVPKYIYSAIFGIPWVIDEKWEFSPPPQTGSVTNRLVSDLILQGLIDQESLFDNHYSLHINVGIPEAINPDRYRLSVLSYALMSTYTNRRRLELGAFGRSLVVHHEAQPIREGAHQKQVSGKTKQFSGRVELRAHAVDRESLYKVVFATESLAAALWAFEKKPSDRNDKEVKLAQIWQDLQKKIEYILEQKGLTIDTLDDLRIKDQKEMARQLFRARAEIKKEIKLASIKIRRVIGGLE